jgi:hypothetical protein
VPEFGEGTSSVAEAKQAAPATRSAKGSIVVPKVSIVGSAEAKDDAARETELEKIVMLQKILSPPAEAELQKVTKAPATTPKRKRMISMLDAVMEKTRALTPAPVKKVAEAVIAHIETEAGPLVPAETKLATTEQTVEEESPDISVALEKNVAEEAKSPAPEAPSKNLD